MIFEGRLRQSVWYVTSMDRAVHNLHIHQEALAACKQCRLPHQFILQNALVLVVKGDLQLRAHHQVLYWSLSLFKNYLDMDSKWLL